MINRIETILMIGPYRFIIGSTQGVDRGILIRNGTTFGTIVNCGYLL